MGGRKPIEFSKVETNFICLTYDKIKNQGNLKDLLPRLFLEEFGRKVCYTTLKKENDRMSKNFNTGITLTLFVFYIFSVIN